MALIWIDDTEIEKVKWFKALTFSEYKRVHDNKDQIKKFIELRLSAIRNTLVQGKNVKEEDLVSILKWLRLVEDQIIPVLVAMKPQIEMSEKDLQPIVAEV